MSDKALVIGISNYPPDIPPLPAVAADVREIAKLLSGEDGNFDKNGVTVLTDKKATREQVLKELKATFGKAPRDQTTFIYLAGHGEPVGRDYYFLPVDVRGSDIPGTGIALSEIKEMFEKSPCERLFLILDFCHSGAILARSASAKTVEEPKKAVARALGVIRGAGRVIMCACTADQKAYESTVHGYFTQYILAGLQGGAMNDGEVTVGSLHDYVDRRMGSSRQRPMFYGTMLGRIVLMHSRGLGKTPAERPARKTADKKTVIADTGTLLLLKDTVFTAKRHHRDADGNLVVEIATDNPEEEAILGGLKGTRYGQSTVSYAYRNTAGFVRVESVETASGAGKPVWTIHLHPEDQGHSGFSFNDMSVQEGQKTYSPDDIAELRARLLLLNEKLPGSSGARGRSFNMLENAISGSSSKVAVKGETLPQLYAKFGDDPEKFLKFARLTSVFILMATQTFENILELKLGPLVGGKLHVKCKGQRRQTYSNRPAAVIQFEGDCDLGVAARS